MTRHCKVWIAAALALTCQVGVGAAEAATRVVSKSGADTGNCVATPCLTIAYAVGQADPEGDTIQIGPGAFEERVSDSGKSLTFVGAGAGALGSAEGPSDTVIFTSLAPGEPPLRVTARASVQALRVRSGSNLNPALAVDGFASLKDVVVEGGDVEGGVAGNAIETSLSASELTMEGGGVEGGDGVQISNAAIRLLGSPRVRLVRTRVVGGSDEVAINGTPQRVLTGAALVSMNGAPEITAEETRFEGGSVGIAVRGGHLTLRRSVSSARWAVPVALSIFGSGTTAEVVDSLLVAGAQLIPPCDLCPTDDPPFAALVNPGNSGNDARLVARGSTFVVQDAGNAGPAVLATSQNPTPIARVELRNSVAHVQGPLAADEAEIVALRGTITAESSAFQSSLARALGTVPAPGSGSNVAAPPQLTAAFAPASGSPLVDRADPQFAEPGALDLAGQPRSLDGNGDCVAVPDIGAYELTGFAAECQSSVRVDRLRLTPKAFRAARSGPVAKDAAAKTGTRVSFRLSADATVRFSVERRLPGRRVRGKCVAPKRAKRRARKCTRRKAVRRSAFSRQGSAGTNRFRYLGRTRRARLRPGRYFLVAKVPAPAGSKPSVARRPFRILPPAARRR